MAHYLCTYLDCGTKRVFFTNSLPDAREQMQGLSGKGQRNPRIFRIGAELPVGGKHRLENNRVYLDCPFEEKDEVKEIGAKWDHLSKKWYVPFELELAPFERWLPDRWTTTPEPKKKKAEQQDDSSVIDFEDFFFAVEAKA